MSFKDCILGKIESGLIQPKRGNDLVAKFEKKVEHYRGQGHTPESAMAAAEEVLKAEAQTIEKKHRNLRQHAIKQAAWNEWANTTPGSIEAKASDTLQRGGFRTETVYKESIKYLNQVADNLKVNYSGISRDTTTITRAVESILGKDVNDPNAVKLGEAMSQAMAYQHSRYNRAGGIMGKIENYFPQITRSEAIIKKGTTRDQWIDYTLPLLDQNKMMDVDTGVPFESSKLRKVMGEVYDSIKTNGRSEMAKKTTKGEMTRAGRGDMDMRRSDARFLKFKDADSFMKYNRDFGVGDGGLAMAFLEYTKSMSRDIAVMETMGPKPNAMMRFMDSKMGAEGNSPVRRGWVNAQYRVLTSSFNHGDTNSAQWKIFTGTQNIIRSAKLGAASLTAIGDSGYIAASAKLAGLDAVRALKYYVQGVAPGDRMIKEIAHRSNFIAEHLNGSAIGDTRFADEALGFGLTRTLANAVNELSGLQRMTTYAQNAISLEAMGTLAEHMAIKASYADLNPDLKKSMSRFGFGEADWNDLLKAKFAEEEGGAKFLITSDLRVDPGLSRVRAEQVADKIDDWTFMLRNMATNEPTLPTRAITTGAILGDGGLATPSRYVGATLGLFKSFPITVTMNHVIPSFKRAFVDRRFDHLAMVAIGTTIASAAGIQLRELINGKTPKDMTKARFWTQSFLAGGGLGLFGDFLFSDYSRFGRDPITEGMGPSVGLADDLLKLTNGNLYKQMDDMESGKDRPQKVGLGAFKIMKENIPLGNLWYSRLAVERLILDNLERMIDPSFDQRVRKYEKKLKKETGQEFWWRPGEARPK